MERSHPEQSRMEFGKPPDQLLTARQVAQRLHVSVSWVQDHASGRCRPVVPSFKLGHAVRFKASEIEAFLERCKRAIERGVPIQ